MDSGSVVAELKRLISAEGRTLLQNHNLLRPLVEQMVMSAAIAGIAVSAEDLDAARLDLLEQQGFESLDDWPQRLENVDRSEQEIVAQLKRLVRRKSFMRERFGPKAEVRCLELKNELDQVVYSLLRLRNSFLARELYLQIDSNESNFADLAKRYAEGSERNTNGIVGQSGSGKSTLMKLLPRLYEPGEGRILIDGYDISKVELYSLRRQVGIVPQDPLLFSGMVSENIALTNPEASSEEIVRAARLANAHDFIMELPSGYSTPVGERGAALSGGQRQLALMDLVASGSIKG